ncbi:Asp-tRNA(Asn)/Glu-tRNA(Gln) amidotransferase subunit GatB [Candidatus Saccharibacteria bacterium CPR2]|nr:Asp-tRNA(Asn)/Glu-tRNA(Gln) amidotransferase subunit GatB [Candidatus Saccharibacteria bacterium CPR2]
MLTNEELLEKYELTVGIECHVQLNTKTKLFSGVSNDAKNAEPNTLISPICFGLPGTLPYLNKEALRLAIKAGLALNAEIALYSKFDRKHYFYPDLPKGYQISQYDEPIIKNGYVDVQINSEIHRIAIERAHLEEDAGKLTHPSGADYTLVDLNRAGTPLLEIVSKPDIHTPAQARAYARELYLLMKYASVSDVDLYHGNMRFDVNVSVALSGSKELGVRTEIKNLNSFMNVEKAAAYEYLRQSGLIERGGKVVQETRGWDDAKQKTFSQRSKEEAHDYRYFPEPDIPPVRLDRKLIEEIKSQMPMLPHDARIFLKDRGIKEENIEVILDQPKILDLIIQLPKGTSNNIYVRAANWLSNEVQRVISENNFDIDKDLNLTAENLLRLSDMIDDGSISFTASKEILETIVKKDVDPKKIAEEKNLIQISDNGELDRIIEEVIKSNAQAIDDIKSGKQEAFGFLIGQVMKKSRGRANPGLVSKILKEKIK